MATVFNESATGGGFGGFGGGGFGGIPYPFPVGGVGHGFGGDGLGLIALLALLGGRGFGRDGDCDKNGGDSNAAIIAALSALNNRDRRDDCDDDCSAAIAAATILSKLGNIEAAIPQSEGSLQLALAQLASQLTGQATANTQFISSGLNALQIAQLTSTAALQKSICDVDTNVDRVGATVINTVRDDGNATRALITANVIQDLRDDKIILANENAELRHDQRHNEHRREVEGLRISIENNNTAVAAQAQAQLQAQQQLQFQQTRFDNERLCARFDGMVNQFARATNNSVNVGNSGAIGTSQTANPTNVNAL